MIAQQMEEYTRSMSEGILPATIISLVPWEIRETVSRLYPGIFIIPKANRGEFSSLVVGPGVHYVYIDVHRGSYPVTNMPFKIAQSVVKDYIDACLLSKNDSHPGLFVVAGAFEDEDEINKKFKKQLEYYEQCQINWFKEQIKIADDDWSKFRLHRLITDTQRIAAKYMGHKADWMIEYTSQNSVNCPACGTTVLSHAVVCFACRFVLNPQAYAEMQFAQQPGIVLPKKEEKENLEE